MRTRFSRAHRWRASGGVLMALVVVACTTTTAGSPTAAVTSGASSSRNTTSPGTSFSTTSSTASGSSSAASSASNSALDEWVPTETNPDPSAAIPDIYVGDPALYSHRYHFAFPDRVAYDRYPPVGGPHDPVWADCDGTEYHVPVRNEHMVHDLEHGAVWITYNPDSIAAPDLAALSSLVAQVSYLVLSPYPDLDSPISLQAWAHQLRLDSTDDPRLVQFITALLRNPYLTPEINATCSQPSFDIDNPPPFDANPPGADAAPMDYEPPAAPTS